MSSSPETAPTPCLSSQAVAITMTYELLFHAVRLPIVIVISISVILRVSYFVLDKFTANHTLLALILTGASTLFARRYIQRIAPSPRDAREGWTKVQVQLPLAVFVLVCVVCRLVLSPLEELFPVRWILTWSPIISWNVTVRAVVFCLALGLSVVMRYIGPPSVMRCSSCPLLEHPFQTSLRNILSNLTTEKLIEVLMAPGANNNPPMMHTHAAAAPHPQLGTPWDYRGKARRFQTPMLTAMVAQVFLTSILSLLVAYISILPIFSLIHGDVASRTSLVLTCLASSLWHLSQTALQYPEINPLRLRGRYGFRYPTSDSLIITSLLGVAFAVLATTYFTHQYHYEMDPTVSANNTSSLWATSLAAGCGIYFYLDVFDRFLQYIICSYGKDMHQVIVEVTDDRSLDAFLEVAIQSLAHGDPKLILSLAEPSTRAYADLERHEVQRHDQVCRSMAEHLLSLSHETSAPLEEDVLRLALLAYYGAGNNLSDTSSEKMNQIRQWIEPPQNRNWQGEPPVVPLVRAISAYIGGLGESLLVCSKPSQQTKRHGPSPWTVAPGAVACATYAIRAGARFLLSNCQASLPTGRLTMLIPVYLSCLYHLESAMMQWAWNVMGATHNREARDVFQTECPEFWPVYQAITEASIAILEALPSREVIQLRDLSPDCSRWVAAIYSKLPAPGGRTSPRSVLPSLGY